MADDIAGPSRPKRTKYASHTSLSDKELISILEDDNFFASSSDDNIRLR